MGPDADQKITFDPPVLVQCNRSVPGICVLKDPPAKAAPLRIEKGVYPIIFGIYRLCIHLWVIDLTWCLFGVFFVTF